MGNVFSSPFVHEGYLFDARTSFLVHSSLGIARGHEPGLESFSVTRHRCSVDTNNSEFIVQESFIGIPREMSLEAGMSEA